jgi:hypothetical protein
LLESQVCKRCVLSSSFPRIKFDENGVCSVCRDYDNWTNGWESKLPEQRKVLNKICSKVKNQHKEFDALIPFSGGKDSSYVLYIAKKELGLNCLAYTFDNGYLSMHARNNIDKTCRKLGIEHLYYRLDTDLMNRLFSLFIRKTGYFCSVCMSAIRMSTSRIADMYNVPVIINGSSMRTELPLSREMIETGALPHVRSVLKGEPLADECHRLLRGNSTRRKFGHLLFFLSGRKTPYTYAWFNLADYVNWNYDLIFDTIRKELDWSSPTEAEHMDCLIHPLQKYIQIRRFTDLDPDRLRYARLIMAGQMTREEALNKLAKEPESVSESVMNLFLTNIGMSKEEFDNYIDMGPRHLQYYSPTVLENLTNRLFKIRNAGHY